MRRYFQVTNTILRIQIGTPFPTEAVEPAFSGEPVADADCSPLCFDPESPRRFELALKDEDIVFGLGEMMRGMNKRGGLYESWAVDDPVHTPDKRSLYAAHNFLIIDGGSGGSNLGLFVDYPGKVSFDVGFTVSDTLTVTAAAADYDIYLIRGASSAEIARGFRQIIGKPYLPPGWAFGYQQSRWGYDTAGTVEALGRRFREEEVPCDAIYLDIDYMERYKDFTIHPDRFPEFSAFVARMRRLGIRLVPIIDAGIRIEEGYSVYEEGLAGGYFCLNTEGKPFTATVWPGRCHFPDFLNPAARRWFGSRYRLLTEAGIEGFWNDMNEPALFFTDEGMAAAMELADKARGRNLMVDQFFALRKAFAFDDMETDFDAFYHRTGDGETVNHAEVHNLYGAAMTRAAAEGLSEINPDARFLLFSRSSYVGMHRYAGLWTGDNASWWEHLLLNIKMMPALNMCGFLYSGADIGGHMLDANGQLVSRWTQFGVFTPLFRNHATRDSREQDPFAFSPAVTDQIRLAIRFRYALIPWLRGEFIHARDHDEPLFAPLAFAYPDPRSRRVEDQLLLGRSIILIPVYEENAPGRFIWAPEPLLLWKVRDYREKELTVLPAGNHWIDVAADEIPVLLRPDSLLLLGEHAQTVAELDHRRLEALVFTTGAGFDYSLPWDGEADSGSLNFFVESDGGARVERHGTCPVERVSLRLVSIDGESRITELAVEAAG